LAVSSDLSGLQPCTTYHFQIVSSNPDGTTKGADNSVFTSFQKPLKNVKAPRRVEHHKKFKVKFTLLFTSSVKIFLKKGHHTLKTYNLDTLSPGKHSKKVRAPRKTGKYTVQVVAREACGKQKVNKTIKVF
jgi:hypothetical protein